MEQLGWINAVASQGKALLYSMCSEFPPSVKILTAMASNSVCVLRVEYAFSSLDCSSDGSQYPKNEFRFIGYWQLEDAGARRSRMVLRAVMFFAECAFIRL